MKLVNVAIVRTNANDEALKDFTEKQFPDAREIKIMPEVTEETGDELINAFHNQTFTSNRDSILVVRQPNAEKCMLLQELAERFNLSHRLIDWN